MRFENTDTLGTHPNWLSIRPLIAESVIESFKVGSLRIPHYGPLIRYCTGPAGLDLRQGYNFFAFPYDWRLDNRIVADSLAQLIAQVDRGVDERLVELLGKLMRDCAGSFRQGGDKLSRI